MPFHLHWPTDWPAVHIEKHVHEGEPSKRKLHIRKDDFCHEKFTIVDSAKGTELYKMMRCPDIKTICIYNPSVQRPIETAAPVCYIEFDKHARKIILQFRDQLLEMHPMERGAYNFRFQTSRWGVLKWLRVEGLLVKLDCVLEGEEEKQVAWVRDEDIYVLNQEWDIVKMAELVISGLAMMEQDRRRIIH